MRSSETPVFKFLNLVAEIPFHVHYKAIGRSDALKISFVEVIILFMVHGHDHGIVILTGCRLQPEAVLMLQLFAISMGINHMDGYMISLQFLQYIGDL